MQDILLLTQPKFTKQIPESIGIVVPIAIEVNETILSSLEDLQIKSYHITGSEVGLPRVPFFTLLLAYSNLMPKTCDDLKWMIDCKNNTSAVDRVCVSRKWAELIII